MLRIPAFLLISLLLAAVPAQALVIDLTADIGASQEVPPTDSLAFGTGVFTYDDVSNVLSWTILFTASLFDTDETMAHIHGPAAVGAEADPLVDLGTGQLKTGMTDLDLLASCSGDPEACESDLLAGLWYVNVHSSEHPDGEIRGQILPPAGVPEPATLSLLLLAGGSALLLRRRVAA
jgi:hypothetical protein